MKRVMGLERCPCKAAAFWKPSRSGSGWMPSFLSRVLSSRKSSAQSPTMWNRKIGTATAKVYQKQHGMQRQQGM